jgi:hypothetical protein
MKKILFIFLFLFSLNFICAVPPVTTTQQFSEGYSIQIPQDNILKQYENYSFEFHVINISNGVPIISGINCSFHLYNSTGEHLLVLYDNESSSDLDYSFLILGNNFSEIGSMYYFVNCNSSSYGGFGESIIYVTSSGFQGTMWLMSICFILFFALTFYGMKIKDDSGLWVSLVGCFGLLILGMYTSFYGVDIYKNDLTTMISYVLIGIGLGIGFKNLMEISNI